MPSSHYYDVLRRCSDLNASIVVLEDYCIPLQKAAAPTLEEFKRLESEVIATLCQIRRFKNQLVPVNSLPDEILSDIFSYLPSAEIASRELYRISAVCHRWRSAAASHAALWSSIHIFQAAEDSAVDQLSTHLAQSKGLPLDIRLESSYASSFLLGLLTRKSTTNRLRSLHLHTSQKTLIQIAKKGITAPHLESIILGKRDDSRSFQLPALFHGDLPALKEAHIQGHASWPRGMLKNLTSLHLHNRGLANMSLEFLLHVLGENPGLQTLKMEKYGPLSEQGPQNPLPLVVQLPHLTHLILKHCDSRLILPQIFTQPKHIEIADYGVMIYDLDMMGDFNISTIILDAAPPDFFHQSHRNKPRETLISIIGTEMRVQITDASGTIITLSEGLDPVFENDLMISAQILGITLRDAFRELTQLIIQFEKNNGLTDYKTSAVEWRGLFNHVKNLEVLEVRHIPLEQLLFALMQQYDVELSRIEELFCPKLQFLRLTPLEDEPAGDQLMSLAILSDGTCRRYACSNNVNLDFSAERFLEVEMGLWLDPEELDLEYLDGHVRRWRDSEVQQGKLFNREILVTGF